MTQPLTTLCLMASLFGADPPSATRLEWKRATHGGAITVTATPGGQLAAAERDLQRLADRLDALRTIEPHVVWRWLEWYDGRVLVHANAESGVYGNVALAAARELFPGFRSAGSGIQQLRAPRTRPQRYGWHVRILLAPKRPPIVIKPRPAPPAKR